MNYVSYVTYFGYVFCIFIGNINQQARNDRNPVYIVIEIIKNVLRQKTHLDYSMWQCAIRSIMHTNTEYVTFNSDIVLLCLVKYGEIVDTIILLTMTHTIYCIAQVLSVQRPGVYGAAYGTVYYKEPLKSFEIRVGHSPGFGLPSVAILP